MIAPAVPIDERSGLRLFEFNIRCNKKKQKIKRSGDQKSFIF